MRNNNQAIVGQLAHRYYRVNKTRNIVLVIAIVLTTVLITSACCLYYNYLKVSKNQALKEIGTTVHAILTDPSPQQIARLNQTGLLQPEMSKTYKAGELVGNQGQAGIRVDIYAVTNWDRFNQSLVDDLQGRYPVVENEVMLSRWLLNRLGVAQPRLGMEIPLTVSINNIDREIGNTEKLSFTLSGFYEDTAYINTENSRKVYVSNAFLIKHPQKLASIGFCFKDTRHYTTKIQQLRESIGLKPGQVIIPAYDGKMNMKISDFLVAAILILFFMLDGYLIIYNVAYISITKDVRFYGLLKTLGATPRQIKGIVYRNVFQTALIALPVGLLLGWAISCYIVPVALSGLNNGMNYTAAIDTRVNAWVLLIAAVFSAITLVVSYRAPAQTASRVSPVEATRYTAAAAALGKPPAQGRKRAQIPYMAWQNMLRHKKRVIIVVLTLFLGSSTFLTLMTVLKSCSVDEYINSQVKHDISLYNHLTRASFSPNEEQQFTPELLAQMARINGIAGLETTTTVPIYQYYSDEKYGRWLKIKNDFQKSVGERLFDKRDFAGEPEINFWGLLIGIDDKKVAEYNRTAKNPIDITAFARGKIALVTNLNGSGLASGTEIPFTVIANQKSFKARIGGQITLARDAMNSGPAPWLVVSNRVIKRYDREAVVYSVKVDAQKGREQRVLADIIALTGQNHSISRISKIELAKSFDHLKRSFSYIALLIAIIFSTIGILNFVNTMLVSIISRKQEFAILESIGATRRQIRRLISFEGAWYALITLALVLTLGNLVNYLVFDTMRQNLGFGTFTYPLSSLLVYTAMVFVVCIIIPIWLYRLVARESIVERLREME